MLIPWSPSSKNGLYVECSQMQKSIPRKVCHFFLNEIFPMKSKYMIKTFKYWVKIIPTFVCRCVICIKNELLKSSYKTGELFLFIFYSNSHIKRADPCHVMHTLHRHIGRQANIFKYVWGCAGRVRFDRLPTSLWMNKESAEFRSPKTEHSCIFPSFHIFFLLVENKYKCF